MMGIFTNPTRLSSGMAPGSSSSSRSSVVGQYGMVDRDNPHYSSRSEAVWTHPPDPMIHPPSVSVATEDDTLMWLTPDEHASLFSDMSDAGQAAGMRRAKGIASARRKESGVPRETRAPRDNQQVVTQTESSMNERMAESRDLASQFAVDARYQGGGI